MEPRILWLVLAPDAALWVAGAGTALALDGLLTPGCDDGRIESGVSAFGLAGTAALLPVGILAVGAGRRS